MAEIDREYFGYWIEHEVWPLEGGCKAVCREKDPHINSPREVIWNPDIPSRPPWVKLFHKAQEAFQAGTLRRVGRGTLEGHSDVVAAEFLAWAQGRGATIPPELSPVAPRPAAATALDETQPSTIVPGNRLPPKAEGGPQGGADGPQWPWGSYETELLRKLADAARKFWLPYEQSKHSKAPIKPPINKQVAGWLTERGVSPRIAAAMATILRDDNQPT